MREHVVRDGSSMEGHNQPLSTQKTRLPTPGGREDERKQKKKSFGGRHEHGMALLPSLTAQLLNPPLSCLRRFFSFFLFAAR